MDRQKGWKFLAPDLGTHSKYGNFYYVAPRPDQEWADWTVHPEPGQPNDNDCGPGGLHIMLDLDACYAPTNWWPWRVRWLSEDELGRSYKKVRVIKLQLKRVPPRTWWRYLRRFGHRTNLRGAHLTEAYLVKANLEGANLEGAHLTKAYLMKADLKGANLERANLEGANLTKAYLVKANLEGANLEGANLTKAYLMKANLEGANLAGANLRGAHLTEAYLVKANLEGANLEGAHLTKAYLMKADLKGANLERANLEGANLTKAYLVKANLEGANLEGANLEGAHLRGALRGALWDRFTTWPNNFTPPTGE